MLWMCSCLPYLTGNNSPKFLICPITSGFYIMHAKTKVNTWKHIKEQMGTYTHLYTGACPASKILSLHSSQHYF